MKKPDTLKDFLRNTVALVGAGYTNVLAVKIPAKKLAKLEAIQNKIAKAYETDKTRSQRAYAKSQGYANFQAIAYREHIFVFHTEGEIKDSIALGKGFVDFQKRRSLDLEISDYLKLVLYRDERGKLTVRLAREVFKDFKNQFELAYKQKSGSLYHSTIKRLSNLPPYRGIQLQKIELIKYLKEQHKNYGVKWHIPFKL